MKQEIFQSKSPNFEKLKDYGFSERGEIYVYEIDIFDGQFLLTVRIDKKQGIETTLLDKLTEEPYTLHLVEGVVGEFVGRVREEYYEKLTNIAQRCFENDVFQSDAAHALITHVREKYGDEPEFLWAKFPDNAIWRRKNNGKWYGAILTVERKKLGMRGEGKVEILDVRAEPLEAELLVDNAHIFKGYHMNKKHWITLPLDGTVPLSELIERLEESYYIAGQK